MHEERDTLSHFVMSIVKYHESHYVAVLDRYADLEFFLLSDDELSQIADRYHIYAGRIISKAFPKLSFLADLIPKHILHQYREQMNRKSEVVTLPVLMKDKKK